MKLYETITAENWGKYNLINHGRGCLLWHIQNSKELRAVESAINAIFSERTRFYSGDIIASFNDHVDTTLDDVLRVCKLADV